MATGTVSSRPPKESAPTQGRYGDFIQQRLEHTRRQVRLVDFGSGIVLLLAASFLFFLFVALADHWLFAHGLNFFARLLLFAVWMAAVGWFTWRAVAPSIMHRINPVFAAQAIEHGRPTLKNSLINFLLLRSHPENVAPVVYQAMEHRAATDLSRVPVDQAVDHRRFIHLCYALAAAVVLFALYVALSPKNPLVSAARVMWPWAALPAPTRVHIGDVQPGDKVVYQGEPEPISAHVSGLREGEDVSLVMSTADGQIIDDRVTMNRTGEDNLYSCKLPPGSGGLLQDTSYRIAAGDATTRPFKLDVEIAPTINVDQVDYRFPAYTGMKDRSIKGQGDIKALEGTRVTIHATANVELKNAQIDLGCSGLGLIAMSANGKQATGEFTLAAEQEKDQAWKPLFSRYLISLPESKEQKARHPIEYRIDVDRDYPPEVSIVEPKPDRVDVAAGGHLLIRLHASDDFGLRLVAIRAVRNGEPLDTPVLLDRLPPNKPLTMPFDFEYDFRPADLHLMKGDEVKYWVEAEDNKEPNHNHAETARRTIRIVDEQDAQRGQANQEKPATGEQRQPGDGQSPQGKSRSEKSAGNSGDSSQDGASKGEISPENKGGHEGDASKPKNPNQNGQSDPSQSDKSKSKDGSSSESKNGESGTSESGDQGGKRTDSETQKADAMRKILEDERKQEQQQNTSQGGGGDSQPGAQQDQTQQNVGKDGGQPAGDPQNGGQPKNPQQSGQDDKSPQGASGDKSQPGGASGSPQPNGNNPSESAANNTRGQEPKPGAQDGGNPGKEKTSPQPGDNAQQPNGASQPQGSPKPGNQSDASQSSPQNSDGKGKDQAKSSAGPKKDGGSSGAENKSDTKPAGGGKNQEQSAPGGSQSPKEKQSGGEKAGSQSGGSQSNANAEKKPSAGGGGTGGEQKPQPGGGQQPDTGSGKSSPGGTKSGKPGNMADSESGQKDPGRAGEPINQNSGQAPAPQLDTAPGEKKVGDSNSTGQKPNDAQSPGNSEKTSKSNGESPGDRKGGGAGGGGGDQHSKKNGKGTQGSHSVGGEEGGKVSDEKGPGATGSKAGETTRTTDNNASPRKESDAGGEKTEPSDRQASNEPQNKDNTQQNSSNTSQSAGSGQSGAPSSQQAGHQGTGDPAGGSQAGDQPPAPPSKTASQGKADDADLELSKHQVDMALRHLKDETSKPKSDLLDRLGWTPEEAKKFAENIEKLRDSAKQPGSEGDKSYNEFLKDLGLRPHGTRIEGGKSGADNFRGVRDAPQMEPPAEWDEISRQYSRTTAGGQK